MIDVQLFRPVFSSAVLTGVVVPVVNVPACQFDGLKPDFVIVQQPDDAGHHERQAGCVNPFRVPPTVQSSSVFGDFSPGMEIVGRVLLIFYGDDLGDAVEQHGKSPFDARDVDGVIMLVEDKHAAIENIGHLTFLYTS